jgi:hypothetical protein
MRHGMYNNRSVIFIEYLTTSCHFTDDDRALKTERREEMDASTIPNCGMIDLHNGLIVYNEFNVTEDNERQMGIDACKMLINELIMTPVASTRLHRGPYRNTDMAYVCEEIVYMRRDFKAYLQTVVRVHLPSFTESRKTMFDNNESRTKWEQWNNIAKFKYVYPGRAAVLAMHDTNCISKFLKLVY